MRRKRKLSLKRSLRLEQDRLSRRIIGVLRRRGKDASKYKHGGRM